MGSFFMENCLFISKRCGDKADFKWKGPGVIIIGRFGREFALVYFIRSSIEVDLNDLRSRIKFPTF